MSLLSSVSDTVLIRIYTSGDDKAFHELFRHYKQSVQKVALHYEADKFLADDLVQEAFLRYLFHWNHSGTRKMESSYPGLFALRITCAWIT